MKKVKDYIKGNIVGFILGAIIFSVIGVTAATILNGTDIQYTGNKVENASNIQDAIDGLYDEANNMVPIDPDTFATNTAKTVYASSKGVCIKRNNKLNCFKINNWDEEKDHIQQVFSDVSCYVSSSDVDCNAVDFSCYVRSYGHVSCVDNSDSSSCNVVGDGSVNCH